MTCIVGVTDRRHVVLGADSLASFDDEAVTDAGSKIWKRGGYVMGGAGSARLCQLAQFVFEPPALPPRGDMLPFMVREFVRALAKTVADSGATKDADTGLELLVGARAQLFLVDADFGVTRPRRGLYGIGTGGLAGRSALLALADSGLTAQQRAEIALGVAAETVMSVRGPFRFVST